MFEFHISRQARDHYQFSESIFSTNGNVIFANFHAARLFAQKMNEARDLITYPEQAVKAGQINAMGLVDEILHHIIQLYRQQINNQVMMQAVAWLEEKIGRARLDRVLLEFTAEFPPVSVYHKELTVEEYLAGETKGTPHRVIALEELLLLWVNNKNPALLPFTDLFDDDRLNRETAYPQVMKEIYQFFEFQPRFGPDSQNIVDVLRAPALANPYSIEAQLEFLREKWGEQLGRYLYRLLSSLDLIKEETKLPFMGPGPTLIPLFGPESGAGEVERFSPDREWMPRLVLIAKNTFVWLDQLSKKYNQTITRLDQIPDEELDTLARWGFSGLWLIGLWERSRASARIKQILGNADAISSAYSLHNYAIAWELGGDEAYTNLRDRAWARGIRLASDMVPNHMGIDSPWVIEHPDWFLSLDYPPYPAYTFNGPDLSSTPGVGIFLEDHYYNRSDAAVVFKRQDFNDGHTQFIYHGNDGTSMPWNDTAQLNYLNPAVREAVIQTILDVARKFPIIRFDAAMTLAKKHYRRLWFPEPGSGGAIPSRSDHSLTSEEFEATYPVEFWREVVDRAAAEAPDTLLLAEAFWLMEGYFVRTLGMHRVYNSAFMNMLRNEENAKYRTLIKNTLEFDPEILKRYVNFMNNPDERTAVDQFGKGDKYIGICLMMATLPGLPMFGHGQIEGYSEKYGMEFRKALWDEQVDHYLVERHEREIFPLLHKRAVFAGVEHFLLYNFFTPESGVDENVFAYSNSQGDDRALVVIHNKFAETRGWIRTSAAYVEKHGDQKVMVQKTLAEGIKIIGKPGDYVIFRDSISRLEFIRPANELAQQGLYLELSAYKAFVFLDFRTVSDDEYGSYRSLFNYLAGRGVPSVEIALRELMLIPIINPFRQIANPNYYRYLQEYRQPSANELPEQLMNEAGVKCQNLLNGIRYMTGDEFDSEEVVKNTVKSLESLYTLGNLKSKLSQPAGKQMMAALAALEEITTKELNWLPLIAWSFTHLLGKVTGEKEYELLSLSWLDEWQLGKQVVESFQNYGLDSNQSQQVYSTLRLLIKHSRWYQKLGSQPLSHILSSLASDEETARYLGINRFQDVLYFNKEGFDRFNSWMYALAVIDSLVDEKSSATSVVERILGAFEIYQNLVKAEKNSSFQVQKLIESVRKPTRERD